MDFYKKLAEFFGNSKFEKCNDWIINDFLITLHLKSDPWTFGSSYYKTQKKKLSQMAWAQLGQIIFHIFLL